MNKRTEIFIKVLIQIWFVTAMMIFSFVKMRIDEIEVTTKVDDIDENNSIN